MNILNNKFSVNPLALALCAVPWVVFAAEPMSDDVKALVMPINNLQLGIQYISDDSSKFGEYSGFNDAGGYPMINFDIRGGDGYGMTDGVGRVEIQGAFLGTDVPEVSVGIEQQGQWKLNLSYEELRHYTTDGSYQTPFEGAMGGNRFILSPNFGVINDAITRDADRVLTSTSQGARTLTPEQLGYFHTEDVYTDRQNTGLKSMYQLDKEWSVKLELNQMVQSGAKLIAASTDKHDLTGNGGFVYGGERVAILMNPTEYQTDRVNLGLNWVGNDGYATVAYSGSTFKDSYTGVTWSSSTMSGTDPVTPATGSNPGTGFPENTMSTPPDNEAHQLSVTGGYRISKDSKLVGSVALGRNTQNQKYDGSYTNTADLNTAPGLPVDSLDGQVDTTHIDARLTNKLSDSWGLVTSLRYNERDNKTKSNTYTFLDLGGDALDVVNIPMSNKRTNLDVTGTYKIASGESLRLGYKYEQVKRWCNNDLANNAQGNLTPANAAYYTTASCVQVPKNEENKLEVDYRKRVYDGVSFNAGISVADRSADVNDSFYNPMQARTSGYENFGYLAYFNASRKQQQVKAGVNWQPSDVMTVGINAKLQKDDYDSDLGVQKGDGQSVNFDMSYSTSPDSMVAFYVSMQQRSRDLLSSNDRNPVSTPGNLWSNTLDDKDNTVGLSAKQKALMDGQLVMDEELTFSSSTSSYSTAIDYTETGFIAAGNTSSGDLPDINSDLTRLKLTGTYSLDKASRVILGYVYSKLESDDYYYNAYQYGYTSTRTIPTNQTAPSYTDHAILAMYSVSF